EQKLSVQCLMKANLQFPYTSIRSPRISGYNSTYHLMKILHLVQPRHPRYPHHPHHPYHLRQRHLHNQQMVLTLRPSQEEQLEERGRRLI
ncbi:hypothetical protein BGW42_007499, partial [Actinomortierella wolfii]